MTDKPQEDVITNAEVTKNDANYVRALESRIVDLERKLQFPESDSSLFVPRTWHESMIANVKAQLPAEMQDCTIRFKECARGHGYLQPDNWVVPPCRQCTIDDLGARVNDLTEKLNLARAHCAFDQAHDRIVELTDLLAIRQTTVEVLAKANADLTDRLSALQSEVSDAWLAYARVSQENERLKHSLHTVTPTVHPKQPVHHDELGPIFKDDLDSQALRDGRLERSQDSRNRILAKHPDSGEAGIEFTSINQCTRPSCPTKHPHRHIMHPTGDKLSSTLEEIVQQRRAHIQAMLDDEKSQIGDPDVIPTKENPNHVKEGSPLTEYPPGRLHQEFPGDQVKEPTLDHSKPKITKTVNDYARERFMAHQKWADGSGEAGPHLTPRRPDEQDDLTEFPGEKVSDIGFRADEPVVTTMENGMIVHSHSSFPGGRAAHSPEIPCHECAKIGETQKFAEASSPVLDTNDPAVQQRFKEAFEQATGLEGHILSANSEEIKISGEYPPFSDETENTPDKKTEER